MKSGWARPYNQHGGLAMRHIFAFVAVLTWLRVSEAEIDWRVDSSFPLFSALSASEAGGWYVAQRDGAAETFDSWYARVAEYGESPFVGDGPRSPWIEDEQRHRAKWLRKYVHSSDVYVVLSVDFGGENCEWRIGDADPVASSCDGFTAPVPLDGVTVAVRRPGSVDSEETAFIQPERLVVLGLGDSFGSGEGNPDRAVEWRNAAVEEGDYGWIRDAQGADPHFLNSEAEWVDDDCHRSFWNYQTYSALRLASESDRRQVVFLHYACSGAEILDGLLVPQRRPPGRNASALSRSQLGIAVTELCAASTEEMGQEIDNLLGQSPYNDLWRTKAWRRNGRSVDVVNCSDERQFVQPDAILLSVGGNDSGFAGLVAWAVLPAEGRNPISNIAFRSTVRRYGTVCPSRPKFLACRAPSFSQLAEQLPRRFQLLASAFEASLSIESERVIVAGYPDPLRRSLQEEGSLQFCADPGRTGDGPNRFTAWDGLRGIVPMRRFVLSNGWDLNVREDEARTIIDSALPRLRRQQAEAARAVGFSYVSESEDAFVGHGWCEIDPESDTPLWLPSTSGFQWGEGACSRNPSCWTYLKPRRRYIRTANDSLLTQSSSRNDGFTGMMHPTAEGHAAIAESVYFRLLDVIF